MHDGPTSKDLLETAHAVLRNDILPDVSSGNKHNVLMIANAMAIAARQIELRCDADKSELLSLRHLFSEALGDDQTPTSSREIAGLNKLLTAEIMSLSFGQPSKRRDEIFTHLVENITRELNISNPKYLKSSS